MSQRASQSSARPLSRRPVKRVKKSETPKLTYLKRSPRVELKTVYETIGAFTPPSSAVNFISYGSVNAGDGYDQRNGKLIQHIDQAVYMRFDLGPAYDSCTFRVIHGVWNDASDPVVPSDILATASVGTPDQWIAPFNVQASRKYHIIADEFFTINNTGTRNAGGTTANTPCAGQLMVKRKYRYKRMQEYQGNSAAQVVDWTHFYIVVSTNGAGTAELCHAVNFIDL